MKKRLTNFLTGSLIMLTGLVATGCDYDFSNNVLPKEKTSKYGFARELISQKDLKILDKQKIKEIIANSGDTPLIYSRELQKQCPQLKGISASSISDYLKSINNSYPKAGQSYEIFDCEK